MCAVQTAVRRVIKEEDGQGLLEYGLILAFVSVASIATLEAVGVGVVGLWDDVLTAFS